MIAWSIHEFFKMINIDFDEVYEELRLSRTFVIDVVTPREAPRINLQHFFGLGLLLRDYCSITRFYNDLNYEMMPHLLSKVEVILLLNAMRKLYVCIFHFGDYKYLDTEARLSFMDLMIAHFPEHPIIK
jgi:hypothetical protein